MKYLYYTDKDTLTNQLIEELTQYVLQKYQGKYKSMDLETRTYWLYIQAKDVIATTKLAEHYHTYPRSIDTIANILEHHSIEDKLLQSLGRYFYYISRGFDGECAVYTCTPETVFTGELPKLEEQKLDRRTY